MSSYFEKLAAKAAAGKRLCVGMDPDTTKIPEGVSVGAFCVDNIGATVKNAAVFKVNVAFFEALGEAGWPTLKSVVDEIRYRDSEMPVIADAKRGDIGNTNKGYVEALFGQLGFDAVTLHNYLGWKGAGEVFTDCADRGFYVLCRTTNPGAPEFQDLPCVFTGDPLIPGVTQKMSGQQIVPLYQVVAHKVATGWNGNGNCGLVVGATYPEELAQVRKIAPGLPFLIPGVGAQGGDLEKAVEGAFSPDLPADFVVNVSSGVLYAYLTDQFKTDPANFVEAAARAVEFYSSEIERIRSAHAARVSLGSSA